MAKRRFPHLVLAAAVALGAPVVGAAPAAAQHVTRYTIASWNMQGATYQGRSVWVSSNLQRGVTNLVPAHDIVALQEAGSLKAVDDAAGRWKCTESVKSLRRARQCAWTVKVGTSRYSRQLYFVETDDRPVGTGDQNSKNNLAFVVDTTEAPVKSWNYIPPIRGEDYYDGDRGLLQLVLADNNVIYTAHANANAPAGINIGALIRKAENANDDVPGATGWVLLGDFNAEPKYIRPALDPWQRLAAPTRATTRKGGLTLDYLIWSDSDQAKGFDAVVFERVAPGPGQQYGSDHRPVSFTES
ncbi:endonuclease/exonuclease/phosphatase family metal-dependent hydrolase [Actinokineospora baliensis]|uniref:endonuclease/exonuclease/phosphatase family protein n=1 Tax=Actinokineospora baliensis TaxID=547056 RepID=UPI00195DBCEA|nr:endonuclease/exonuclease/phosphatase family protein [Actinokineospora baliensis]MBM7776529.1 endonuclease/exonuclease/phosphatase family metal-dependent hydrolase [Actinokineospora baliensis]